MAGRGVLAAAAAERDVTQAGSTAVRAVTAKASMPISAAAGSEALASVATPLKALAPMCYGEAWQTAPLRSCNGKTSCAVSAVEGRYD